MIKYCFAPAALEPGKKKGKPIVLAIIKLGAFAPVISGKIGGTIFSRNSGGAYIKNMAIPVNPATVYQVSARNLLSYFAAQWRTLTAANQALWNAFAILNPVINRVGDTVTLSGFNLYCQLNINMNLCGTGPILVPPVPAAFTVVSPLTITPACSGGAITLAFTVSPIPSATAYLISATPALSPGISFVKSQLRMFHVSAAAVTTPILLTTFYTSRFGTPPAGVGAKLFFTVQAINTSTGYAGIPLKASCLSS